MVETEGVEVPIQVDEKSWNRLLARFDETDRRIKRTGETARREGRSIGAFGAAVVGGASGFAASVIANNPVTNALTELIVSMLAAALLPLMMKIVDFLDKHKEKIEDAVEAGKEFVGPIWDATKDAGHELADWAAEDNAPANVLMGPVGAGLFQRIGDFLESDIGAAAMGPAGIAMSGDQRASLLMGPTHGASDQRGEADQPGRWRTVAGALGGPLAAWTFSRDRLWGPDQVG
jgi:tetrahydromethanopterin S-methyltransferase subunit G